jgi:hypothetical protein
MSAKTLVLPYSYGLRKQDDNTWWLQYYGMDSLRIEASVPCGPGGSIDQEMERFAAAMLGWIDVDNGKDT